jgi:hypothetical protein
VTDAALAEPAGLTQFQSLDLYGCPGVTGAGLVHLAGLPELEWLNLSLTRVGDAAVDALSRLRRLEYLGLEYTLMTAAGRERLRRALGDDLTIQG